MLESMSEKYIPENAGNSKDIVWKNTAYSIAKVGHQWGNVEIGFNPEDGTIGNFQFKPCGTDKELAIENFKIAVATKLDF
jgi:hypothetical protein